MIIFSISKTFTNYSNSYERCHPTWFIIYCIHWFIIISRYPFIFIFILTVLFVFWLVPFLAVLTSIFSVKNKMRKFCTSSKNLSTSPYIFFKILSWPDHVGNPTYTIFGNASQALSSDNWVPRSDQFECVIFQIFKILTTDYEYI